MRASLKHKPGAIKHTAQVRSDDSAVGLTTQPV